MPMRCVFCLVTSHLQADQVLRGLRTAGFSPNDISALFPNPVRSRDSVPAGSTPGHRSKPWAAGRTAGWAALRGGFPSFGTLTFPGAGQYLASGPIVFALSGAEVRASASGIADGLIGLGIPEEDARRYEGKIREGLILISVNTQPSTQRIPAEEIFEEARAQDICATGEAFFSQGKSGNRARAASLPGCLQPRSHSIAETSPAIAARRSQG